MTPILRVFFLLCSFPLSFPSRADCETTYLFNFDIGRYPWKLVFPTPAAPLIYTDLDVALDIQSVVCDGAVVQPEIKLRLREAEHRTASLVDTNAIYQCWRHHLQCWADLGLQEPLVHMRLYEIPDRAKKVEVSYTVRYPSGERSEPIKVTFIESIREASILTLPDEQWLPLIEKEAEPGATDNPDDAQHFREDH